MRLAFLEPLYTEPGPFASVYLDTSRDVDDPDQAIALRWRHLRDELSRQGADPQSIAILERTVGADADIPGLHGQALFTAHGALALADELPKPPAHDVARFGALPDALPLAAQHAPEIPYLAVIVHYGGPPTAEAEGTVTVDAEAGSWPVSRVTHGERLHRHGPVAEWHDTAARLGQELDQWARRADADALVLGGNQWACNVLARRLPDRLRASVVRVAGPTPTDTGRALLERQLEGVFGGRMAAHDRALLETFLARRARDGATAEGLPATVAALQRGQVDALFLNDRPESSLRLWVGPEPTQLALAEEPLSSFGVETRRQERAGAALIRAVVGTGAELVLVPEEELRLIDGIGALLRYTDRGTQS
jgi:hypothetical protein